MDPKVEWLNQSIKNFDKTSVWFALAEGEREKFLQHQLANASCGSDGKKII